MANFGDENDSESSFTTTSSTGRIWGDWISGNAAEWSKEQEDRRAIPQLKFGRPQGEVFSTEVETQPPPDSDRALTPTEAITEVSLTVLADDLREDRRDARQRAREVWRWMVRFAVGGALLVLLGAVLWLFGIVKVAGVVAIDGVLSGGGGFGVFWKLYRSEKAGLKNIRRDLQFFDSRRLGLILATQITDPEERDRRIGKLMDELARIRSGSDSDPDLSAE